MVVRIPKTLLQKGMYIETVECPDSEFSSRRFLIKSNSELDAVLATSAKEVVVNRSKSMPDSLPARVLQKSDAARHHSDSAEEMRIQMRSALSASASDLRGRFAALRSGGLGLEGFSPVAGAAAAWLEASPEIFIEVTRLRSKDEGSYIHSLSVSALMANLARSVGMPADTVAELGVAGLLHDVGKLLVPNAILNKTGPLTLSERKVMCTHPERGYQLLRKHEAASDIVLSVCRLHHEALDGSGYPLGLFAPDLSLPVRISTVCDVFDAITSVRPYKRAWSIRQALDWMFERHHLFDSKLVLRLADSLA